MANNYQDPALAGLEAELNNLAPVNQAPLTEQAMPAEPVEDAGEYAQDEQIQTQANDSQQANTTGPKQSWKELREKAQLAEQLQKERDEYLNVIKNIYQQQQQQQQYVAPKPQVEETFDYDSLDDDEIVDARSFKKALVAEQRARKKLEEDMRANQRVTYERAVESALEKKYSDLRNVVTPENLQRLAQVKPSIARSLQYYPDYSDALNDAYEAIRDNVIQASGGIPTPNYDTTKQQIQRNMSKPRTVASVGPQGGNNPLSAANAYMNNDMSKEAREKRYRAALSKVTGD